MRTSTKEMEIVKTKHSMNWKLPGLALQHTGDRDLEITGISLTSSY